MARHCGGRAEDDELHAGACYGYVHATQVAQEADVAAVVVAHQRDEYDVALLTLKSVDSVDGDEPAVGTKTLALAYHLAQQLHLGTIGRDDAHVDRLVEHALTANLVEIVGESGEREFCLGTVDATEVFAYELLAAVDIGGVNPHHGAVVVENATSAHLGSRLHARVVEVVA